MKIMFEVGRGSPIVRLPVWVIFFRETVSAFLKSAGAKN